MEATKAPLACGGNHNKAGLPEKEVEKERIKQIVDEVSKGSKFYNFQRRKEEKIDLKVEKLRQKQAKMILTDPQIFERTKIITDALINKVKKEQDLSRIYMHIDMDAFYAAVETQKRPELANVPMAVGGTAMLSTANYAARKFGVVSAMPGYIAKKLCPQLVIVPSDFKAYGEASSIVRSVLVEYDPNFISYSMDEASLDLTNCFLERKKPLNELVAEIREKVKNKTNGLTCSAGVACNRKLAKMCSNENKPNGQHIIPNSLVDVNNYVSRKPVKCISGVGAVTNKILTDLIKAKTCADLIEQAPWVKLLFSEIQSSFLISSALGLIEPNSEDYSDESGCIQKSLSHSTTFRATSDKDFIKNTIIELSTQLVESLNQNNWEIKTVTLRIKTSEFDEHTKAITLSKFISKSDEISKVAIDIYEKNYLKSELRLVGVGVSNIISKDDKSTKSIATFFKSTTPNSTPNTSPLGSNKISENVEKVIERKRKNDLTSLENWTNKVKSEVEMSAVICPICHKVIESRPNDMIRINTHIDSCLNVTSSGTSSNSKKCGNKKVKIENKIMASFFHSKRS